MAMEPIDLMSPADLSHSDVVTIQSGKRTVPWLEVAQGKEDNKNNNPSIRKIYPGKASCLAHFGTEVGLFSFSFCVLYKKCIPYLILLVLARHSWQLTTITL